MNYCSGTISISNTKDGNEESTLESRSKGGDSSILQSQSLSLQSLHQSLHTARSSEGEVFVELPYWLDTPRGWALWTYTEQKQHVQKEEATRKRKAMVERKIVREMVRLERMEKESLYAWETTYRLVEQTSNESELKMMLTEEEMLDAENVRLA